MRLAASSVTVGSDRGRAYLWLCLSASLVAFSGFSITYFGPMLRGEYPPASPVVHLHGWAFFLWYGLLPTQAGLVAVRRVGLHRTLGQASLILAVVMVATGLIVVGAQMELARLPDGSPFWRFLGPSIFVTLVLFAAFYGLALWFRKRQAFHKRLMLLASTGALGAAAFRLAGAVIGFGPEAGAIGLLAPNVLILAAIAVDMARGGGVHVVFRFGLPASVALEGGMLLLTPTPPGQVVASVLAWSGRLLAGLY
ncbi:MAG: hypothetical protein AB7O28_26405 [Vicinamibacterales bacterium]